MAACWRWLSRGQGARVSLMTLKRGESGRQRHRLRAVRRPRADPNRGAAVADRYYGVDQQYFATVVDYGFSKRLDETLDKWGRENVLARCRPRHPHRASAGARSSRFQGNERDGHGNHSAAGLLSRRRRSRPAGDPRRSPSRSPAGLRPWQPLKLYMGGVREKRGLDAPRRCRRVRPVLGESYQRSPASASASSARRTAAASDPQPGPAFWYYKRLESVGRRRPAKEQSFFDGIDTTIPGLSDAAASTHRRRGGAAAAIDREIGGAVRAFTLANPSASAPALARAPGRDARGRPRARPRSRRRVPAVDQGAAVRGRHARRARGAADGRRAACRGGRSDRAVRCRRCRRCRRSCQVRPSTSARRSPPRHRSAARSPPIVTIDAGARWKDRCRTRRQLPAVLRAPGGSRSRLPEDATGHASVFLPRARSRTPLYDGRRDVREPSASASRRSTRRATYKVDGVPVEIRRPVTRRRSQSALRRRVIRALAVVPALRSTLTPAHAVVPLSGAGEDDPVTVRGPQQPRGEHRKAACAEAAAGWTATPASQPFEFSRAGERAHLSLHGRARRHERTRTYRIEAVASRRRPRISRGLRVDPAPRPRDALPLSRRGRRASAASTCSVAPGLKVGYVMGVGDEVPAGHRAARGRTCSCSASRTSRAATSSAFDAIMTGTRAYAVRDDLQDLQPAAARLRAGTAAT